MNFLTKNKNSALPAERFRRSRCIWLIVWVLVPMLVRAQDPDLFPRPPELEPAIGFWVRVYTEVDTQHGFLHDSRNLAVIYSSVPRERQVVESTRTRISADLRVLGSGRRSGLTRSQQEILALWPDGVSNQTLLTAASNVRFQLGQSDRFLGGLQRSGAYRAHIRRVIAEKNLPQELGVLPHVESSFNPGAYSSASAAGMWQFGRATGQRFMRIDHIVDERMDPYTATDAAMSLLQYNYSALGTWPLALTAYNHGAGGIARAVRQTETTDIETIIANYNGRAFGFASRNFYPQFLAVLEVENRAEEFFGSVRFDPAPDFIEVVTDAFINAEAFARSVGISLEQLRADNPALRPAVWSGNKRIPWGFPVKVRAAAVDGSNLLAMIPNQFKFTMQTPDVEYVVERGDSLSVIASRFDTTVGELVSMNQLASRNRIQIGQRLLLPQDNLDNQALVSIAVLGDDGVYTVRRGDTVSLIAERYGIGEQELLGINGIRDRHLIYPGQELRLPRRAPETETSSTRQVATVPTVVDQEEVALTPVAESVGQSTEEGGAAASEEAVPELVLAEASLPPAAVLPDNQEMESPMTQAEGDAVALDPAIDLVASNEQLSELLAADPSDYSVASNNSIEIQASETLGHYAEWLGVRAWDLRRLNGMAYGDPVIIGERLQLDFSRVNIAEFELKRRDFHSSLQREFFGNYRIEGVEDYSVRSGDNIGSVARSLFSTPLWLLRQYNPELDLNRIQVGQEVDFPILERAQ